MPVTGLTIKRLKHFSLKLMNNMNEFNILAGGEKGTSHWTDRDWYKFRKWLKGMLQIDVGTVTFTKKDGTERIMKCTLNSKILPAPNVTENKKSRKINLDVIPVYDVEENSWRSFSIKSIKEIRFNIC